MVDLGMGGHVPRAAHFRTFEGSKVYIKSENYTSVEIKKEPKTATSEAFQRNPYIKIYGPFANYLQIACHKAKIKEETHAGHRIQIFLMFFDETSWPHFVYTRDLTFWSWWFFSFLDYNKFRDHWSGNNIPFESLSQLLSIDTLIICKQRCINWIIVIRKFSIFGFFVCSFSLAYCAHCSILCNYKW